MPFWIIPTPHKPHVSLDVAIEGTPSATTGAFGGDDRTAELGSGVFSAGQSWPGACRSEAVPVGTAGIILRVCPDQPTARAQMAAFLNQ